MPSNVCWGIEIGSGGVKALKVEYDGEKPIITEFVDIPHAKVLSDPSVVANDALRVSLGALVSQFDLSGASVGISVPGHSSFARFAKLPPVEPKKVPDIVRFEAVQQIPFPLEEVEWDYQTFMSPESPDIEVGIFAITKERVNERLNLLTDVGITPDFITLSPVALYNALAYDLQFTESTPGTILLDIGTTSTDLVVAESGRVWIRTFPLGGHQFTEALIAQFKLGYGKAEKIKREVHDSKHARQVFQAMRPVFTDLTQDVQRSIGYYQSLHREANLTRLIGVGSTFQLPGLRKYLKQQLQLDVYRLEEFKRADLSKLGEERAAQLKGAALSFATAYGLAIQGLGLNPIKANLMPVSVVREAMWKKKAPWFAAAAGLGIAAGAAMFIRPLLDSNAVAGVSPDPVIQQAVRQAQELKGKAAEAGVLEAGQPDMTAANLLALTEHRELYGRVLADLSAILADADAKAATWTGRPRPGAEAPKPLGAPGFEFRGFRTQYTGPGRGDAEGGEPADPNAMGSVQVTLQVATRQPDPLDFILHSVDAWLRENKDRKDAPYAIVYKDPIFTLVSAAQPPAQATASAGAVGEGVPAAGGARGELVDPRLAAEGGGRGGRGVVGEGVMTEGGPPVGGTGQAGGDLGQIAPLSLLREAKPDEGKPAVYDIRFELKLRPKPTGEEGSGEASTEGSR